MRSLRHYLSVLFRACKRHGRVILLILFVGISATTLTIATVFWLHSNKVLRIPSIGNIHVLGVEAYGGNISFEKGETYLNWGVISPGQQVVRSFFLRSVSNIETLISLNTSNWEPSNFSDYMELTWDYDGSALRPGKSIWVNLTLEASSSDVFREYLSENRIDSFRFDIVIRTSNFDGYRFTTHRHT